jgi:hypothetical protein
VKITVTLDLDVNVDDWQAEYHWNTTAEALKDALRELRTTENYLGSGKWDGLVEVKRVQATIIL